MYMYTPSLEVAAACSQQVVVRMPVNGEDSGTKRLLNVFAHPPGNVL